MEELAMFGVGDLSHDDRYAYAAEWIEVVERLWTDGRSSTSTVASSTSGAATSSPSRCDGLTRRS
jgi:alkanesulfonate monooxygenase SsuD/methylene tetrahydromethanopterin reductase-like flavin-dependent oxidoreductase (luciferase family)